MNRFPKAGYILIAGYLLLALLISQLLHFSLALDEGYHLEYITFIKQQGRLPISYEERSQITRADFPPLYHLGVALLSGRTEVAGPPSFKLFWDSFRYQAADHLADEVWLIETEDFQWPYFGEFLVWQIGRWFSIVLSLATVIVVFFTLRDTPLGQKPLLPLAGAALLAFIPRYIMLGSALNDDNLLGLVAVLYFWMLVKIINQPRRWWPFVTMGILVGVSMTVKYTLIIVPLEIVVVFGWLAYTGQLGWGWAWRRIGAVAGLALLSSSWWFGWNIWFMNTVADDGWLVGLLRPVLTGGHDTTLNRIGGIFSQGETGLTTLPPDTTVGTFPEWMRATFLSFWGPGTADFDPFFPYPYVMIGFLLALAGLGLGRVWRTRPAARPWLTLFLFHIAIFFLLPLIRFTLTRRLSVAAQGRHILIPAATAVTALLVWGLATMIPRPWQRWGFAVLVGGFILWTGGHLYELATAAPPLPVRTMPQAAEWLAQPAHVPFGESIELVSYQIEPQPEQGRIQIDLAWRSLKAVNENYLLQVELVNADDQVVSHWIGYNGQGRLPTLAWDPGDSIFDRLTLPLPDLPAGDYRVYLQWVGRGAPVPIDAEPDGKLLLADLSLSASEPVTGQKSDPNAESDQALLDFSLWRASGPVEEEDTLPVYRYPATISLLLNFPLSQTDILVTLVDPAGQAWPATKHSPGIYSFVIGPRWPSGDYRLQVEGSQELADQLTAAPILTVENWWERRFEPPEIAVPLKANFANQVKLLGYKLPQERVIAGEAFPVTLYWQAPAEITPQADFIQFNHLLNAQGALQGGYDRRPLEYYSTLLWAPGEVVVDGYAVPVEADAPPGEYYLDIGLYLTVGESAVNLPLVADGQMTDVTSVTLGPIEVVAP